MEWQGAEWSDDATEGNVSLGELFTAVKNNTVRTAINELDGKRQHPTFKTSLTVGENWKIKMMN